MRRSLKAELMAILKATDKKARLTAEQQDRLRKLADSPEEEQEIGKLIEESIEANRPKAVSENAYEPPSTAAILFDC